MTDKARAREIWDNEAAREKIDLWDRIWEPLLVAGWRKRLLASASGRVLEIAAGRGVNFPHYAASCQIVATDLSQGQLHRARTRGEQLGLKVDLSTADVEALAFPDDSFDTVVEFYSLCCFPNPITALQEMGRVCREDGRILLLEHGRSRYSLLARVQDWDVRTDHFYGCHWNRRFDVLVYQAGLSVASVERRNFGMAYLIEARPPHWGR